MIFKLHHKKEYEYKLIKIAIDHAKEMAEKKVKKLVEDALEKESEDELLN